MIWPGEHDTTTQASQASRSSRREGVSELILWEREGFFSVYTCTSSLDCGMARRFIGISWPLGAWFLDEEKKRQTTYVM